MRRFDGTEIPDADLARFRELVDSHKWIFAKTYADFCPHYYTLKKQGWLNEDLTWFVEFIWKNGFNAWYGKSCDKRYFVDDERGWYYFIFPDDTDRDGRATGLTTLVNGAKLSQWELDEEVSLFETAYRWKLKRGWRDVEVEP